jgi:hypothetical protein
MHSEEIRVMNPHPLEIPYRETIAKIYPGWVIGGLLTPGKAGYFTYVISIVGLPEGNPTIIERLS